MLQRMRELAVQSASGTMSSTDRTALEVEFEALASKQSVQRYSMERMTSLTEHPGMARSFHVGANASEDQHFCN